MPWCRGCGRHFKKRTKFQKYCMTCLMHRSKGGWGRLRKLRPLKWARKRK